MKILKGYIYVRNHESYDIYGACKMGKASNIPERDNQYATGEIKRGHFYPVFEVPMEQMGNIERFLKDEFQPWNVKFNAGTEFYSKNIISLIEPNLLSLGIAFRPLPKEEINSLIRTHRIKKILKKINTTSLIKFLKSYHKERKYIPRDYQTEMITKSCEYFQTNDKGLLVIPCGVGKTLISLWIAESLRCNTILIGVPNILLLDQWKETLSHIFKNVVCLTVLSGVTTETIMEFLAKHDKRCIVITTYASSYKVLNASQNISFEFNMKILDEVHHLTSNNFTEDEKKTYIKMLKIKSKKQLSLTATLKLLENNENTREDEIVVSNDNIEYFGEIIDRKSFLWAINKNIICDYMIQTIITKEEKLEQYFEKFCIKDENDKRLFLSAFASLKSISENHSHHLLIYSNDKTNCLKIIKYIRLLIVNNYFDLPELYSSSYHSEIKTKHQIKIIDNFKNSRHGIISCVYCLGEGWDFPLLDGVVFAENMSSIIRIVQSILRANRKNKLQPNKIAKIILPILNRDNWLENNENPDLKKVREIIYQMGLEDETISQKIKVFRILIEPNPKPMPTPQDRDIVSDFGEYDEELTQRLRLKTMTRTSLGTSYEKAIKINAYNNVKSKEAYYELCERDNRLSKEPEITYHGKFTNWIDYLSIERIYYDLEMCKSKVTEYLLLYPEIKQYHLDLSIIIYKLCKIDSLFPPNGLWCEYYNVKDLQQILTIKPDKKKIGIIL